MLVSSLAILGMTIRESPRLQTAKLNDYSSKALHPAA